MLNITKTKTQKQVIFTAGLPGSGKSTYLKSSEFSNLQIVDCDEFKKLHKNYDEKNISFEVHEFSKKLARKLHVELLTKNESFIIDGTGTNLEKYIAYFKEARKNNFKVVFIYVRVTVETSKKRNAMRDRNVCESVIYQKANIIDECCEILGERSDTFIIIDND